MIALKCSKCGSENLIAGGYRYSFICVDCEESLELYDVSFTLKPDDSANIALNQSAREAFKPLKTVGA